MCRMELQVSQWLVLNLGALPPHRPPQTSHAAWDAHAVHGVHAGYSVNIPRSVGC
jgi:hypothetical protein